jgi:aspartyl/asparaginyl beta-hydroxylase (cupin superfamily)
MALSEAEIDDLLAREPRNIDALVQKGDRRAAADDHRGASAFYKAALAAASAQGTLPSSLKPALDRALAGVRRAEAMFLDHLERSLAVDGFATGSRPARFQQALDILLGRSEARPRMQRPTGFYYPGLAEQLYFDPAQFAWAHDIEAASESMLAELGAAQRAGFDSFTPYLVADATRPRTDFHGLHDNPDWSTLQLWEKGRPVALADHFPRTLAAVEATDVPRISVRAPNILFSKLAAGARIPPHHGMLNARLICHLPLVVPPGCGFRVGGKTREWEQGKLLIFDDTIEHEAWNKGQGDRIILIFDVWHPDLDQHERRAIMSLFNAIDAL